MNKEKHKHFKKQQRKGRVRSKIMGSEIRPRLCVYRSLNYIYVQLINDVKGVTIAYADDRAIKEGNKSQRAYKVGEMIAQKAKALGIEAVVFDRGGNTFHGRIKEVAQGARQGGLQF